jgi:hypothetical protein
MKTKRSNQLKALDEIEESEEDSRLELMLDKVYGEGD